MEIKTESLRQCGKPLTQEEKWLVLNVYNRCRDEAKSMNIPITNAYERASYYSGVSRKVVVEIVCHFRKKGTIPPVAKAGNQNNHDKLIHSNAITQIREFIFEQHRAGAACNTNHIKDLLQNNFQLEKISDRTIQRELNRLGFEYKRTKPKTRSLREKEYVRQQRHTYLYELKNLRNEGYMPVYLDESFLHHYHGQQFSWFTEGDFLERPSGKGRRWCFIHAIAPEGLLPHCSMIFEGKKSTGDYHGSFNFEVFYEWFQKQLLPNVPDKSCIIMDRATYHMVPEERLTLTQMKKADIRQWLTKHKIHWEEHWLKPKLMETIEQCIDRTPLVQKEAQRKGYKLLILPVHHPEFNPIELVWAIVKNKCAKKLRNGISFKDVLKHLQDGFNNEVSKDTAKKLYKHVREKEEQLWKFDIESDFIDELV